MCGYFINIISHTNAINKNCKWTYLCGRADRNFKTSPCTCFPDNIIYAEITTSRKSK